MSILKMSHADYLNHSAYGSSDIIKMRESFAYYAEKKKNPDPSGRPLVVGSATHLMLQGALTNDKKLILDGILTYKDGSSGTKGFREFQAANPKVYCVDQEEYLLCQRMTLAILNEEAVMEYLKDAIPEVTVITKYPNTNIEVKCRPDYLHQKHGVCLNIKTAADASESGFLYSARDYGTDWQSTFYCDVLKAGLNKSFDEIHVVVGKGDTAAECPVSLFMFDEDTIQFARSQLWEILTRLPECEKTGIWPKNKAYLQQVGLPLYMRKVVHI